MATLDVAFVKYYVEAISNAYLTFPQRLTNLFPKDFYAKLKITDAGTQNWHFKDDGTGRYVTDTEFNVGLIGANATVEPNVPIEGTLPDETTKTSFTLAVELYTDDAYTKKYATNTSTVNVHMYIQQSDGTWGSSNLTEEQVVYKKWETPIGDTKSAWLGNRGHTTKIEYTNSNDGLFLHYLGVTNTDNNYYQGFTDADSVLGVYSGISAGYTAGETPSWKCTVELLDYDGSNAIPFNGKFVAFTAKNEFGDDNVTAGAFANSATVPAGASMKFVINTFNSWVGIARTTFTNSTTQHLNIGDIIAFNKL